MCGKTGASNATTTICQICQNGEECQLLRRVENIRNLSQSIALILTNCYSSSKPCKITIYHQLEQPRKKWVQHHMMCHQLFGCNIELDARLLSSNTLKWPGVDLEVIKTAPRKWASLIVSAPKNGSALQFGVNCKKPNAVTGRYSYLIQRRDR